MQVSPLDDAEVAPGLKLMCEMSCAFGGHIMITKQTGLAFGLALFAGVACAAEGPSPEGVPSLKHVFLIMMENHGFSQIFNNPNAPFTNSLAKTANLATNYFAVAHPSLTNYLEVVGGPYFALPRDPEHDSPHTP